MSDSFYAIAEGTRALVQPSGIFIFNRHINSFEVANVTGREVFLQLLHGYRTSKIVNNLLPEFEEVGRHTLTADVIRFLGSLCRRGYILEQPPPSPTVPIQCLQLTDLSDQLKMVYAVIDLTNRCNQTCKYCYAESDSAPADLPASAWLRMLGERHRLGLRAVVLSGGEPLLHGGFWDVLAFCDGHFIVEVNTNAQLIDSEVAKRFASYHLKAVQVSVDSLTPAVHDCFRGDGTWARAMQGITSLREHGVPVRMSMTVRPDTVSHIPALRDYAAANGCSFNAIAVKRAGRARSFAESFWESPLADQSEVPVGSECDRFEVHCGGLVGFAAIASDGRTKACNMQPSFFERIGGGMDAQMAHARLSCSAYQETSVGRAFQEIERIGPQRIKEATQAEALDYPNCILERYFRFLSMRPTQTARKEDLLS